MRLLPLVLAPLFLAPAHAQRFEEVAPDPLPVSRERIGALDIPRVRPEGVAAVLANAKIPAIALEGSRDEWAQSPQVLLRVQDWARRGGVVITHTDAAQHFGFKTLRARESTSRRAGQLFGRARPSLHFGLHPLLWKGLSSSSEGATFGSIGVRVVFYRMAPGDVLALGHWHGTPILRATDLATPVMDEVGVATGQPSNPKEPLQVSDFRQPFTSTERHLAPGAPLINVQHAAAMAPFGRGWAMILPRRIETHRGDGSTFARNVANLISGLAARKWIGVPSAPIERAYDRWKRGRRVDWLRVAQEVRAGVADEEVLASDEDVRAMLDRDADQVLSRAQIEARFGAVRKAARNRAEGDFFFEVAAGQEAAKRRRLLYLAQSRFRLLLSPGELERTLEAFEAAGREQNARGLRAEKLPVESSEDAPPEASPLIPSQTQSDSESESPTQAGGAEAWAEAVPQSVDERTMPGYKGAAARMFLLRTQTRALSDKVWPSDVSSWARTARRLSVEPGEFWLWRGILAAGEADNSSINAWLRGVTMGDALESWRRALLTARGPRASIDAELPLPDVGAAFGGDESIARREKSLRDEREAASTSEASSEAESTSGAPARPSLPVEVCSVPGEEILRWARGAALAREVLRRDAPVGGEMFSSRLHAPSLGALDLGSPAVSPLWADAITHLLGGPTAQIEKGVSWGSPGVTSLLGLNLFADMGWVPPTARRGWFEDAERGPALQGAALMELDIFNPFQREPPPQKVPFREDWRLYADNLRPTLVSQCRRAMEWHSRRAFFGWGADRQDITLVPSNGALGALTSAIARAASQAAADEAREEKKSAPNFRALRQSLSDSVAQDKSARAASNVPPALALSAPAVAASANGGSTLGTRLFVPTIPDTAEWKTAYRIGVMLRAANRPETGIVLSGSGPAPDWEGLKRRLAIRQARAMVGIPTLLARGHADTMIHTVTEGGTPPPAWMRDGFVSLSRQFMARAMLDPEERARHSFRIDLPLRERPVSKFAFDQQQALNKDALDALRAAKGLPAAPAPAPLDGAKLPASDFYAIDQSDGGVWWRSEQEYFATCAQIALAGLGENPGTVLLPRLYEQAGPGGVTEIMQRPGSGASVDEAFAAVVGVGEEAWVARAMGRRGR